MIKICEILSTYGILGLLIEGILMGLAAFIQTLRSSNEAFMQKWRHYRRAMRNKDLSEIKLTKIKGYIFERDILFSKKFSDLKKIQEHKNYIIIAH